MKQNRIKLQDFFDNVLLFTNPNSDSVFESFDIPERLANATKEAYKAIPENLYEIVEDCHVDINKIIKEKVFSVLKEYNIAERTDICDEMKGIEHEIIEKIKDELLQSCHVFEGLINESDFDCLVSDREMMKAAIEKLMDFIVMFPQYEIRVFKKK